MQEKLDQRRRAAERVTLIGSVIDLILGVIKIVIGSTSHSAALVADGVHSLSDLATDFMVIVVLRLSHRGPDKNHPWGHGRYETVGTVALGTLLIVVGLGMVYEIGFTVLHEGAQPIPAWPALIAAAISIVAKEWIFRYSLKIGQDLNSDLLIANAWHSRTDAMSSVVVLIAVAGAMLGLWWLDALAAIIVAIMVGKIGWELVAKSVSELVDTALPPERVAQYRDIVMGVEGVLSVHGFKTRATSNQALLEMHIQVKPYVSAAEAHFIGDTAVCALQGAFEDIDHVIFHIDTFDDRPYHDVVCPVMPCRSDITKQVWNTLLNALGESSSIEQQDVDLMLFYHPEYVDVELRVSGHVVAELAARSINQREFEKRIVADLTQQPWCREVWIWWASTV
ncbi:MAG TPA: cation diffusion facilitator family transporter [Pseudomonadales bacterium]|nr:cation diffusion facilitator family transporter [Pseudomonadales bacterium]